MNQFDRIYQLYDIFRAHRYPITMRELERQMECSQPTVKRMIAKLRHELAAPIRYEKRQNGYILDREGGDQYELPGLWFSLAELQALLTGRGGCLKIFRQTGARTALPEKRGRSWRKRREKRW